MSPMTRCLILLMCSLLIGQIFPGAKSQETQSFSSIYWNYMIMHNGDFSNDNTEGKTLGKQSLLNATLYPINLDFMQPYNVLTFIERVDGELIRLHVCKVIQEAANIIKLIHYNVTNLSYYDKNAGPLTAERMAQLTSDDVQLLEDCFFRFQFIEGCFVGGWEVCGRMIAGHHPHYALSICCGYVTVVVPAGNQESFTDLPYYMRQNINFRSQIPGLPANFTSICDKKNNCP